MALIGYGEADFYNMRSKGYYYVDRTSFIPKLENMGNRNLLFARPRRFGKSLWISTLQYYYDACFKDKFDMLFGNLYIGQHPTPDRNKYVVLRIQFSGIDVSTDESAYQGFRTNVLTGIRDCMNNYPNYYSKEDFAEIQLLRSPESMIQTFFSIHKSKRTPYKIYTLLDEYDHFANELYTLDMERFQNILSRTGFVRKFYEILKNSIGEGTVGKNFMTGVAPLTVDAMTSGFNTATHITLRALFHDLMGFTKTEVEAIMRAIGATEAELPQLISDLTEWYDGYSFNKGGKERLYNSDMVMYFAEQYEESHTYPEMMLDTNIASDYTKVRKVFVTNTKDTVYIPLLKQIIKEGQVSAVLTNIFNFEKEFNEFDITSLLFYMGWLTIQEPDEGAYLFKIPNRVIQELYYDYFVAISEEEMNLNRTHVDIHNALTVLSKTNNPRPFLELIRVLIEKRLAVRDAQNFDEKHLKMLLIPYLSLSATHYVKSEPEWENQFPDILFAKRPAIETKYNFIFELKYIKKADKNLKNPNTGEKHITKVTNEGRQQLKNYLQTDDAKRLPNLKAWLLVLVGRDWQLIEEVPVVI
jgi:Predicted AAA-ATPase/PD-(D/E)XK nuclease superfamily